MARRKPTEGNGDEDGERDLEGLPAVPEVEEVVLDSRGFPAGQFKRTIEPIVGKVSKKSPLYVRMHTLGRGIQDFVVAEVTTKGVVIKPPWSKADQIYRIGERGRSYDVFVHRAYGTRHATVYEGMATPPTHLVEGRWVDADPASDASFLKLLSTFEGIAKLMNIEEPLPAWFWVLAALAFLSPVVEILRLFV